MTGNLAVAAGILVITLGATTARAQTTTAQPLTGPSLVSHGHVLLQEPFDNLSFDPRELTAHPERFLDRSSAAWNAFEYLQKVGIATSG